MTHKHLLVPAIEGTIVLVEQWAAARNIIGGATALGQFPKLISEAGEISEAIEEEDDNKAVEMLKDGIGDTLVVATIMSKQLGGTIAENIGIAINSGPYSRELMVHFGRLGDALAKNQLEVAQLMLGRVALTLNEYADTFAEGLCDDAEKFRFTLADAYAYAYDQIKDRRGVMYQGVFVKSTDERYVGICEELGLSAE